MDMKVEGTVIMARCANKQAPYGMRLQKTGSGWVCTWTFAMKEAAAKREGYTGTTVKGEIALGAEYPGCPHCGAGGFVQCGKCGKISCFRHEQKSAVCPHCGNKMENFSHDGNFDEVKGDAY